MLHQNVFGLELVRIAIDACKCCTEHKHNGGIDANEVVINLDEDIEAIFNDAVNSTKLGVFFMKSTNAIANIIIKKGSIVTDNYQNAIKQWCNKTKSGKIQIILHLKELSQLNDINDHYMQQFKFFNPNTNEYLTMMTLCILNNEGSYMKMLDRKVYDNAPWNAMSLKELVFTFHNTWKSSPGVCVMKKGSFDLLLSDINSNTYDTDQKKSLFLKKCIVQQDRCLRMYDGNASFKAASKFGNKYYQLFLQLKKYKSLLNKVDTHHINNIMNLVGVDKIDVKTFRYVEKTVKPKSTKID